HGADADEAAKANVLFAGPVEDGGADGAALAEQGDPAWAGHAGGEAGIQAAGRVDHPQAVGTDQAQLALGRRADLPLQHPPLLAAPRPCSPSSEKPALMMTPPRTRCATQSAIIAGTVAAGVAITARSTASGTSARPA